MSSATLLVAERNDLVGAARIAVSVFPHVELVTADAGELVASAESSRPSAAIVPASGTRTDGLALCRELKRRFPECPVMVIVDDPSGRAAAVQAGADDIVVGAPDADRLRVRLGRLKGVSFRRGDRADFPLTVNLTLGGQTYPAQSVAMSKDALYIAWPSPPAAGTAMKVAFSPYEGKTIDVWGRVQQAAATEGIDAEGALVRFLGLTDDENDAVAYLVDYYMKAAGITPQQGNGVSPFEGASPFDSSEDADDETTSKSQLNPPGSAAARTTSKIVPELMLGEAAGKEPDPSDPWDQLTETSAGRQMIMGSLIEVSTVDPEQLALGAAKYSKDRDATALPGGITADEVRGFLPRLSPAETSAMRGTSTLADMTGVLLQCAGIRLAAMVLTARFRTLTKKINDAELQIGAEEAVNRIIQATEDAMDHLQKHLQDRLASGNLDAARDLKAVHQGLGGNLQDLKRALAGNVFGANEQVKKAEAQAAKAHDQARYQREAFEERPSDTGRSGKKKDKKKGARKARDTRPPRNTKSLVFLIIVLLGAIGGTVWTYLPKPKPVFIAPTVDFTVDNVNVITVLDLDNELRVFLDGTYDQVPPTSRAEVLKKIVETARLRAGADPAKLITVHSHDRRDLAETAPDGTVVIK